ncbi:MAG: hypothetical protein ACLPX5_11180 [Dissulfurispiraceae bacterium]
MGEIAFLKETCTDGNSFFLHVKWVDLNAEDGNSEKEISQIEQFDEIVLSSGVLNMSACQTNSDSTYRAVQHD